MSIVEYIKQAVSVNGTLLGFEYQGKEGNFLLWN